MSNVDTGPSFTCGLLMGAAFGALAALLLAPRSGAELRSGLEEGRRKLRETKARTVSELRDSGKEIHVAYDKARGAISHAAEDVKQAARGVVMTPSGTES